jgi:tetratricopeptide (TPR) repeat protein
MVALCERARRLLGIFEEIGDERGMSDAYVMQAWGLVAQGATDLALDMAARALRLAESAGYLGGQARAHHVTALCEAGEIDTGQTLLTRALGMSRALCDEYVEALSLLYLGRLHVARRDPEAGATLNTVLTLARRSRLPHYVADALKTLGELDLAEGRAEQAVARLEESVRIWRTRGWLAFLADGLTSLGEARLAAEGKEGAREAWTEACELYRGLADDRAVDLMTGRLDRLDPASAC